MIFRFKVTKINLKKKNRVHKSYKTNTHLLKIKNCMKIHEKYHKVIQNLETKLLSNIVKIKNRIQDKDQIMEGMEKCLAMRGIMINKDKNLAICKKKINYIRKQDFRQVM